ncbi:hypothetical protein LAUMK136_04291 [Mycobacterium attenuatum]|uniref:Uncharacterized protein n=1 Tax=Mycobacterium attenuatum TaxID=2341086 RepID=A0A498QE14_9MYCO|nr:hypothetical protein [Mycobacterium attenuatum]VBA41890.1 hypothetical protein LAUMK136_04291 [Mycobacterium attenuatum]
MSYPDHGPPRHTAAAPHPQPAPPPVFGAAPPGYGIPAPAYGTAMSGGYRAGRPPSAVTTAAVISFGLGGMEILIHLFVLLFLLDILDIKHFVTDAWRVGEGVFALVRLALGVLFIWGGIAAVKGRTRKVLLVVSVVEAILSILLLPIGVFTLLAAGIGVIIIFFAFLELTFVGTILILILQPASKEFFRTRTQTTSLG